MKMLLNQMQVIYQMILDVNKTDRQYRELKIQECLNNGIDPHSVMEDQILLDLKTQSIVLWECLRGLENIINQQNKPEDYIKPEQYIYGVVEIEKTIID